MFERVRLTREFAASVVAIITVKFKSNLARIDLNFSMDFVAALTRRRHH